MKLESRWIDYDAEGARIPAYCVRASAAKERLPAVVVIQEAWGPDEHIQDVAERFAAAGYLALAPDLFARDNTGGVMSAERIKQVRFFLDSLGPQAWGDPSLRDAALANLPGEQAEVIRETMSVLLTPNRPYDRYIADLRAAVSHLRSDAECDGLVVSVGFCLGGGLSARLACSEPALAAAVIFYGAAPPLDQVSSIECRVLGLYGAEDHRITDGVGEFASAMEAAAKSFEYEVYENAPHAFFNDTRPSYRPSAARAAWARTLSFFATQLTDLFESDPA
ncbi:MAG TPA: dienelactone hydrolase family protein [Candidatus Sulfotelmatobacter sp.]|nr:dienelactone hydrolase family protein [Candidatus Sulfotelmatobacter sp.]